MANVRNTAWALVGGGALAAGAVACSAILGDFDTTGGPPLPDAAADSASDTGTDHAAPPVDSGQDAPAVDAGNDAPMCGGNGQACCGGNMCTGTLMCTGGTCQPCPTGQALCGGSCVDTQTSNMNCGGCGLTCSACNAGECLVTLASNLPNVTGITINAIKAYVTTNQASGSIYSMSLSGGGATMLLSPNYPQNEPFGIVVDAQNVYWTNSGSGTVMKMPIGGQVAPTTIASGQANPSMMAIDSTNVYWTNDASPGALMKVPLGGGAATTVFGGLGGPSGLAIDSTYAYVAVTSDDYVIKVQLSTGTVVSQITNPENNPYGLAIDQNNVYFTNNANMGDVRQVAKTDSKVNGIVLLDKLTQPSGVATDGTSVYWAAGNAIYKAQVGVAGSGKIIAANQSGAAFVAVDGTSVYWTNSTAGTVMKLTPK